MFQSPATSMFPLIPGSAAAAASLASTGAPSPSVSLNTQAAAEYAAVRHAHSVLAAAAAAAAAATIAQRGVTPWGPYAPPPGPGGFPSAMGGNTWAGSAGMGAASGATHAAPEAFMPPFPWPYAAPALPPNASPFPPHAAMPYGPGAAAPGAPMLPMPWQAPTPTHPPLNPAYLLSGMLPPGPLAPPHFYSQYGMLSLPPLPLSSSSSEISSAVPSGPMPLPQESQPAPIHYNTRTQLPAQLRNFQYPHAPPPASPSPPVLDSAAATVPSPPGSNGSGNAANNQPETAGASAVGTSRAATSAPHHASRAGASAAPNTSGVGANATMSGGGSGSNGQTTISPHNSSSGRATDAPSKESSPPTTHSHPHSRTHHAAPGRQHSGTSEQPTAQQQSGSSGMASQDNTPEPTQPRNTHPHTAQNHSSPAQPPDASSGSSSSDESYYEAGKPSGPGKQKSTQRQRRSQPERSFRPIATNSAGGVIVGYGAAPVPPGKQKWVSLTLDPMKVTSTKDLLEKRHFLLFRRQRAPKGFRRDIHAKIEEAEAFSGMLRKRVTDLTEALSSAHKRASLLRTQLAAVRALPRTMHLPQILAVAAPHLAGVPTVLPPGYVAAMPVGSAPPS